MDRLTLHLFRILFLARTGLRLKMNNSAAVFIVGCPRSGTTLLQSLIASHPGFVAFPETNLLYVLADDFAYRRTGTLGGRRLLPKMFFWRLLNRLGYTMSPLVKERFEEFLKDVKREDLCDLIPKNTHSIRAVVQSFVCMMNNLSGGRRWIDKSPQNIYVLDIISRFICNAQFVHIVRDGCDTVASMYDAGLRYKGPFNRYSDVNNGLERAIRGWNAALRISHRYINHPRHVVVRYEDVVENPRHALSPIEELLNIKFETEQLCYQTNGIVTKRELWKGQSGPIRQPEQKFQTVLRDDQRMYVAARILDVDRFIPRSFD